LPDINYIYFPLIIFFDTFNWFVKAGVYPNDWGGKPDMKLMDVSRGE
jgi:hypothetical protein